MFRIIFVFIVFFCSSASFGQVSEFKCVLVGKVIDRPYSHELVLTKEQGDSRVTGLVIPIQDGQFYYELEAYHEETYSLAFVDEQNKGAWRPIVFFAEPDTIHMTLYPVDRFGENEIIGGKLNRENIEFQQQVEQLFGLYSIDKRRDSLREKGLYLTEEAKKLFEQLEQEKDMTIRDSLELLARELHESNKSLTPEAQKLHKDYDKRFMEWIEWKSDQIMSQASLVTYRELLVLLQMARSPHSRPLPISVPELLTSFEKKYRSAFPDHPYTYAIETYLESVSSIKKGGKYIDFTAPDFEGNQVNLSEYIHGKVALIHLWASWCGPCRRKGIEMIPIYEEYQSKGFEIVGIARERDKKWGIQAAETDKYPWLNLLELNDDQNIWRKYGLDNSGGGVFLVDENGVILAVEPTAGEVRDILKEKLD